MSCRRRTFTKFFAAARMILYSCTVCPVIEAAVRFKVFLLRERGRRLPWRKVMNGPHYVGELLTYAVQTGEERYTVATLRPLDPAAPSPIPELYGPVLLGFAPVAFRLRGFERLDGPGGRLAVVQ